jgi:hypothetical protein
MSRAGASVPEILSFSGPLANLADRIDIAGLEKRCGALFWDARPTILRLTPLAGDLTPHARFPIVAIEVDGEHHSIRVAQRDPDRQ